MGSSNILKEILTIFEKFPPQPVMNSPYVCKSLLHNKVLSIFFIIVVFPIPFFPIRT